MRAAWSGIALVCGLLCVGLTQARETGAPASGGMPADRGASTPSGLTAEAWSDIQRQIAQARYEAAPLGAEPGVVSAHNPGQDLLLRFDVDGIRLASLRQPGTRDAVPQFGLRTLAMQRGDAALDVAPAAPVADRNRVEYRHPGWTEWYINEAAGVEHGYTLDQRPLAGPAQQLRIVLAVSGLEAHETGDGSLRFSDATGRSLHYGKLLVEDADGRRLPATLSAPARDRIEIAFDDHDARYPVIVDPLIVNEEQFIPNPGDVAGGSWGVGQSVAVDGDTLLLGAPLALGTGAVYVYTRSNALWFLQARLTAADAGSGDRFGTSVALAGDTALVGAEFDDSGATNRGSAYVFVRAAGTWTQQAQLTAADGAASDQFGTAVALSGDIAVVGADRDNVNANTDQGTAYVFVRSGTAWTQQAQLSAGDGAANDFFGSAVAIDGESVVVGAFLDDAGSNLDQGSAYVFVRAGTLWSQQQKLSVVDGAGGDRFGTSVSLAGDTAVIGAPEDDVEPGDNRGSAYVFVRAAGVWSQQAQLNALDGTLGDFFGSAVAVSGDTALIGAGNDDVAANGNQGSAYVFVRTGSSWTQQAQLTAGDGAAADFFGSAVALDGGTALVGAFRDDVNGQLDQGSASVFVRSGTSWTAQAQLTAAGDAASDEFAASVAIEGDTALIAAPDDSGPAGSQGVVHVFVRAGRTWSRQARLLASDGSAGDRFGSAVALSGDTALIGAESDAVGGSTGQGSAYVFVRTGSSWTEQAQLLAGNGGDGDRFGVSVALDGNTAVVGASNDDIGAANSQGSAYFYQRSGASWTLQSQVVATDGEAFAFFGFAVAVDGDTALIGASGDTVGASAGQGSVYVFTRSGGSWAQQTRFSAGGERDGFGGAVALEGDVALIGAPSAGFDDDFGTFRPGRAYVFTRSSGSWTQSAVLAAADFENLNRFGVSVALSGPVAVIGAPGLGSGVAIVYARGGGTWTEQLRLVAANGESGDEFGNAVALTEDTLLIGARRDDLAVGDQAGSARVYRIPTDYGDAPLAATLRIDDGARHYIDSDFLRLGFLINAELDGQPNADATGDDSSLSDDGVSFSALPPGGSGTMTVVVTAPATARLDAWVDFNADGDWLDAGERIVEHLEVVTSTQMLSFAVPAQAVAGQSFARVRLSTHGVASPLGLAIDGEVEDDAVTIGVADSDGDGLPDDWEDANGLDRNDPTDAGLDADGDGLSNLEEFNAGTDPNDVDTDADGIGDAVDADPLTASNACSGVDAVFENTLVLSGTVAQCAASGSVEVRSTVTVEPGGRIEVIAPQTGLVPGFSLPVGGLLSITPEGAP